MEYMETDLSILIRNQTVLLTEEHIKNIMIQILEGVKVLHQNFLMHRDLAPGNLLISHDGKLKITDFGLAKNFGSPNK